MNVVFTIFFSVKVTGGNKGVGYSVVRKLLKKFRGVVYLTGWWSTKMLIDPYV